MVSKNSADDLCEFFHRQPHSEVKIPRLECASVWEEAERREDADTHIHSFMYAHPADPRVQVKKLVHFLWKRAKELGMRAVESTRVNRANKTNQHLAVLGGDVCTEMKRKRLREEEERGASQLPAPNLVSSPFSVNRWKWAIAPFDVARQNFYHPTSLLLLVDLSADFKAPLLPPPSLSSHFNPLQQSPSVQSTQEKTATQTFSSTPSSLCWVAITAPLARWPAPAIN